MQFLWEGVRWGGCLFEAGHLLTFSAFRMGTYSRWALIQGWALIRINAIIAFPLKIPLLLCEKKKQSPLTIFQGKFSALKIQMRYIQNPCPDETQKKHTYNGDCAKANKATILENSCDCESITGNK